MIRLCRLVILGVVLVLSAFLDAHEPRNMTVFRSTICAIVFLTCSSVLADDAPDNTSASGSGKSGGYAGVKAAPMPVATNGLKGIAGYAHGRSDLSAEQIRLGFALAMPKTDEDRKRILTLIRQAKDSLFFRVWKDYAATPLSVAATRADKEMVSAILAKGVAVDDTLPSQWSSGQTALMDTIIGIHFSEPLKTPITFPPPEAHLETLRFLLNAGANPNARTSDGRTALALALRLEPTNEAGEDVKVGIVKALLDAGATPGNGLTLGSSNNEQDIKITVLLLGHGLDPKAPDSTALAAAVHYKRSAVVRLLLAKGANPNARALMANRTVLADAAVMGQFDIATALAAAGAKTNVCSDEDAQGHCTNYSQPLIFMAVRDPTFFRELVAKGANPNAEDALGQTALGYVLTQGRIKKICVAGTSRCIDPPQMDRVVAVRLLLDAGADPNRRSANRAPLTLADDNDHQIIDLLLVHGARLETAVGAGERIGPISQAIAAHREYLAGELLRRAKDRLGADEKWGLFSSALQGKAEVATQLVKKGVRVNERGILGETALHYAVREGNAAMVRQLLALGADPNAQTKSLSSATSLPSPMNALLPSSEAQEKIYDVLGLRLPGIGDGNVSPLMLAVLSGDPDVTRALLAGGADVALKSEHGVTAAALARQTGNSEMIKLFSGR